MIPSARRASLARHHSVTIAVSGNVTISAFATRRTLHRMVSRPVRNAPRGSAAYLL